MADEYRGSEGGHWYASPATVKLGIARYAGEPIERVPSADGRNTVNATAQNAPKWHLAPGTTSVLKGMNKPVLTEWACKTTAKAATTKDPETNLSPAERFLMEAIDEPTYIEECLRVKAQIGGKAADEGSIIHGYLERGFLGETLDGIALEYFKTVRDKLIETYGPDIEWVPERPFHYQYEDESGGLRGFGGRTDILGRRKGAQDVIVVDFKTRDFTPAHLEYALKAKAKKQKTLGKLTPYETEPPQIAANLVGHRQGKGDRLIGGNLYVSRLDPNLAFMFEYSDSELVKAWANFRALHTIYVNTRGIPGC